MINNKAIVLGGVAAIALTVAGCGGSNSGKSAAKTGVFIDSVVAGASYKSMPSGLKGKTNAKGEFKYKEGDYVSFAVGAINLGSAKANPKVYVRSVRPKGVDIPNRVSTIKMSQFLLTMDTDGNPANGIQIWDKIDTLKKADFPTVDFSADTNVDNTSALQTWASGKQGHKAATINTAIAHLEKHMPNKSLNPDTFTLKSVNGTVDCAAPNKLSGGEKGLQVVRHLSQENALNFIKGKTFIAGSYCSDKVHAQKVIFDKTGNAINPTSGKVDFTADVVKKGFASTGIADECDKAGACTLRFKVYHSANYSHFISEETINSTGKTNRYIWNYSFSTK